MPRPNPKQRAPIIRPAFGHHGGGDGEFEDQIPADNSCDELAERRIRERVGAAGHRHRRGELRVAQRGRPQAIAAKTNEIEIAGPVMLPAVDAVIVKMPAPITTDTPKTVRSHHVKSLRGGCPAHRCRQSTAPQTSSARARPLGPLPGPISGMYRVLCTRWGGLLNTQSSSGPASAACAPRACVGLLRAGHGLRARRAAGRTGEPVRSTPGQARPPADGARRPGVRGALPWSARRDGRRRGADSGEPAGLHPLRRAGHVLGTHHRLQTEFTAYVPSRPQLEWQIRRRVTAIENVDLVRAAVSELDSTPPGSG